MPGRYTEDWVHFFELLSPVSIYLLAISFRTNRETRDRIELAFEDIKKGRGRRLGLCQASMPFTLCLGGMVFCSGYWAPWMYKLSFRNRIKRSWCVYG